MLDCFQANPRFLVETNLLWLLNKKNLQICIIMHGPVALKVFEETLLPTGEHNNPIFRIFTCSVFFDTYMIKKMSSKRTYRSSEFLMSKAWLAGQPSLLPSFGANMQIALDLEMNGQEFHSSFPTYRQLDHGKHDLNRKWSHSPHCGQYEENPLWIILPTFRDIKRLFSQTS